MAENKTRELLAQCSQLSPLQSAAVASILGAAVVDAAAIVHQDSLIVVASVSHAVPPQTLLTQLKGLPAGHVPSELKLVDKLPMTASGKIDRKLLAKQLQQARLQPRSRLAAAGAASSWQTARRAGW